MALGHRLTGRRLGPRNDDTSRRPTASPQRPPGRDPVRRSRICRRSEEVLCRGYDSCSVGPATPACSSALAPMSRIGRRLHHPRGRSAHLADQGVRDRTRPPTAPRSPTLCVMATDGQNVPETPDGGWHTKVGSPPPAAATHRGRGAGDESRTRVLSLGNRTGRSGLDRVGRDRTADLQVLESVDRPGRARTTADVPLVCHGDGASSSGGPLCVTSSPARAGGVGQAGSGRPPRTCAGSERITAAATSASSYSARITSPS